MSAILDNLFNRKRDKSRHDALLARDEALTAAGAGMPQPDRRAALLSFVADQEDKQAATSAMEARLNQQQLGGGASGPIAAPAPVADIQGGGIYGAQQPQPSMQTSMLNQLLRRAFVGDKADGAMKWFDRDRYYAQREAEAKSALSAREGAVKERATADAEEQAGANWRQAGLASAIPGGSVLNNRAIARFVQQMGGPLDLNKVLSQGRFPNEYQNAYASKAVADGMVNTAPGNINVSPIGGLNVLGSRTGKETVIDPITKMPVEREINYPAQVVRDGMSGQGGGRYGSQPSSSSVGDNFNSIYNGYNNGGSPTAPIEAALGNGGTQDVGVAPSPEQAARVKALNEHQRAMAEVNAMVRGPEERATEQRARPPATEEPIAKDLMSRFGAGTSNIDPVDYLEGYVNKIMPYHPFNLWRNTVGKTPAFMESIFGDPFTKGSIFGGIPDTLQKTFWPVDTSEDKTKK